MQKEGGNKGERSQTEEGSILVPIDELLSFSLSDKEDIVSQEFSPLSRIVAGKFPISRF